MSNIVPFNFESHSIRTVQGEDGEPLFVAKDVALALGYKDTVSAIKTHCKGVAIYHPIEDSLGRTQEVRVIQEPDVYRLIVSSKLPKAQEFERLVFEEILPSIRKTGKYAVEQPKAIPGPAASIAHDMYAVAELFECPIHYAAQVATQEVYRQTGVDISDLMAHSKHADRPEQEYLEPTECGMRLGMSAKEFNLLLHDAGFQTRRGKEWVPTDTGRDLCIKHAWSKNGKSGYNLKWRLADLPVELF